MLGMTLSDVCSTIVSIQVPLLQQSSVTGYRGQIRVTSDTSQNNPYIPLHIAYNETADFISYLAIV